MYPTLSPGCAPPDSGSRPWTRGRGPPGAACPGTASRCSSPALYYIYCIVLYLDIVMLYCLTEPTFMRMARERSSSNLTVAAQWSTISASRRRVSRSAEVLLITTLASLSSLAPHSGGDPCVQRQEKQSNAYNPQPNISIIIFIETAQISKIYWISNI